MVIRWAPWEVATSALFTQSQHRSRDTRARLAIPVHQPAFWVVLLAAAAAAQYGVLRPGLTGELPLTTYQVAYQFVGGSFAVCGIAAWRRRPDSGSGPLMTATGFTFFIYPLLAQLDLPAAQTLALVLSNLWAVLFVTLALTYGTGGRVATPADRRLIAAYAIAVIGLELVLMLFRDMPGDVLAAFPDARLAQDLDRVRRFVVLCMNVVIAAVLVMRWRAASRPRRKVLLPSLAAAVCLLLFCGQLVFFVVTVEESQTLAWVAVPSLLLVPAAFLAGLLRSRLAHGGLTELFQSLHGLRGAALESSLARAMGDPSLLLAYRVGHSPAYAGTDGSALSLPTADRDRLVAPVRRDGHEVAALIYDAALDDDRALVEAVRSAAEIALEHEGLQAESQARLVELQASRRRIVDAGDAERRRLERNLHDGAQQRLVALALQLRLIQSDIRRDPAEAERLVTRAGDELAQSLDELRELARGIHPAVLDHGLPAAIESLAARTTVPTAVSCDVPAPLPQAVELALYFVACEALTNVAKYADAQTASVRISSLPDRIAIEVADDGIGGADTRAGSGLSGLVDRVAALGGRFSVTSPVGHGTVVTAELPSP